MKKKKLKRLLEVERAKSQRYDADADKMFGILKALWQANPGRYSAVRKLIRQKDPGFHSRLMFEITDSMLKEWYVPAIKAQLEQTNMIFNVVSERTSDAGRTP